MSDGITLKDVMETMIHHRLQAEQQLEDLRKEMNAEFGKVYERFDEVDKRFDQIWKATNEDLHAQHDDILEVKKFVGMPLPAFE